jgi:hypothetical protein
MDRWNGVSLDGKWRWDGAAWLPTGVRLGLKGLRSAPIPKTFWVAQAALAGEGIAIGFMALPVAAIAAISLIAGIAAPQVDTLAVAGVSIGAIAVLLAAVGGLWLLIAKTGPVLNVWSLAAFGVELALVSVGYLLIAVSDYLTATAGTPSNPGTDGPFADGFTGGIALMGVAFFAGGTILLTALLVEAVKVLVIRAMGNTTAPGAVSGGA